MGDSCSKKNFHGSRKTFIITKLPQSQAEWAVNEWNINGQLVDGTIL